MALFLSVILALVVTFIAVAAMTLLGDRVEVIEEDSLAYGLPKRSFSAQMTGNDWYAVIMLGVLAGLVNYFSPSTSAMAWVAPLCYITMLGLFIYLMVWWHRDGSELSEMIPFIVLAVLFYFPARAAAYATAAMVASPFWSQILVTLPLCFLVATIGFFIIDYFYFRSEMEALSKRGETSWQA